MRRTIFRSRRSFSRVRRAPADRGPTIEIARGPFSLRGSSKERERKLLDARAIGETSGRYRIAGTLSLCFFVVLTRAPLRRIAAARTPSHYPLARVFSRTRTPEEKKEFSDVKARRENVVTRKESERNKDKI